VQTMRIRLLRLLLLLSFSLPAQAADPGGTFVRYKMIEPVNSTYYVKLSGVLLSAPWYMRAGYCPSDAVTNAQARVKSGEFTPWINVRDLVPKGEERKFLSRREKNSRGDGFAEFPNVTADFIVESPGTARKVVIELATAPDEQHIVRRFEQTIPYSNILVNVSPDLEKDAVYLETGDEMTERRLRWAKEVTGGKAHVPKQLMVITGLGQQRADLDLKEAETVHLLGFNTLSCLATPPSLPVLGSYDFGDMVFGGIGGNGILSPTMDATREQCAKEVQASLRFKNFFGKHLRVITLGDEMGSERFTRGTQTVPTALALTNFHAWLAKRNITPEFLGVNSLDEVVPMDTPKGLPSGAGLTDVPMKRLWYLSCRYRQEVTTDHLQWMTEEAHKVYGTTNVSIHVMPADHPFLGATGLGYRNSPNWPESLAADWFDLARRPALDSLGIEDWLGLQYMYGPACTWEGFQLLGYMAEIFQSGARSGGRDEMPCIGWITVSDETNVCLKSASLLAHGVKNFFFWTYGPTSLSTENYWSDVRSEYRGIASITRDLAMGEDLLVPGRRRPTRLAMFYSISSDIWQPYDMITMMERRLTYFSLMHNQYRVDMLTEEDVAAGRLRNYDALYVTDPCIATAAVAGIAEWVRAGGRLYGSAAAGSRDEYNEPASGLSQVFGLEPGATFTSVPGNYAGRTGLNAMPYLNYVKIGNATNGPEFGALGIVGAIKPLRTAQVAGVFTNGQPAVVENRFGKGTARYIATCPALSYMKDAKFAVRELKEKWPAVQRAIINQTAEEAKISRPVEISSPVVETGLYDSPKGLALVLANFTYEPIKKLDVSVKQAKGVVSVESVEHGKIPFRLGRDGILRFSLPLGLKDLVLLKRETKTKP